MSCRNNKSEVLQNLLVKGTLNGGKVKVGEVAACQATLNCLEIPDKTINAVIGPAGTTITSSQSLFTTVQDAVTEADRWDLGLIQLNIVTAGVYAEDLVASNQSTASYLHISGPVEPQFGRGYSQLLPVAGTLPTNMGAGTAGLATTPNTITVTATVNPNFSALNILSGDALYVYSAATGLVQKMTIVSATNNIITTSAAPPDLSGTGSSITFGPRVEVQSLALNRSSPGFGEYLGLINTGATAVTPFGGSAPAIHLTNSFVRVSSPAVALYAIQYAAPSSIEATITNSAVYSALAVNVRDRHTVHADSNLIVSEDSTIAAASQVAVTANSAGHLNLANGNVLIGRPEGTLHEVRTGGSSGSVGTRYHVIDGVVNVDAPAVHVWADGKATFNGSTITSDDVDLVLHVLLERLGKLDTFDHVSTFTALNVIGEHFRLQNVGHLHLGGGATSVLSEGSIGINGLVQSTSSADVATTYTSIAVTNVRVGNTTPTVGTGGAAITNSLDTAPFLSQASFSVYT